MQILSYYISIHERVLIFAYSVDPDEMPQSVTFHLGFHCLSQYPVKMSIMPLSYGCRCDRNVNNLKNNFLYVFNVTIANLSDACFKFHGKLF